MQEIDVDLDIRFVLYAIFGAITCVSSLICLVVFFSSQELRTKYIMFWALSIGNFLNGLSFVLAGVFRIRALIQGTYYDHIDNNECLLGTPFGIMMVIAGQIPALLNVFTTFDKVVALQFAPFYRGQPIFLHKYVYIALTVILTTIFVGIAVILNAYFPSFNNNRMCAVMDSTGIYYGTVHFSLIAIAHIGCFIVLWILFHRNNKRRVTNAGELRRQRMILALNLLLVFLVSIPSLALILNQWKTPPMNTLIVGIIYCLYAVHSAFPLFIFTYFRLDFRARLFRLFRCEKLRSTRIHSEDQLRSVAVVKVAHQ